MKRDMELIRLLLQEIEGEEPKPDLSGYSDAAKLYHLDLMEEEGLVRGTILRDGGRACVANIDRLTNAGHDFLEASRSDTIWRKFKEKLLDVGGGVSMPVATELLKKLVREALGL
jgi:hypothetical protein